MTRPGGVASEVKSPLVVNEQGALLFFESVDDAERYLEAIDVEDGRYSAFDSEGRSLLLTTVDERRPVLFGLLKVPSKQVIVEAEQAEPAQAEALRENLAAFLRHLGVPAAELGDSVPLESLLRLAIERAGFTK
jgi:hypothetical protein